MSEEPQPGVDEQWVERAQQGDRRAFEKLLVPDNGQYKIICAANCGGLVGSGCLF